MGFRRPPSAALSGCPRAGSVVVRTITRRPTSAAVRGSSGPHPPTYVTLRSGRRTKLPLPWIFRRGLLLEYGEGASQCRRADLVPVGQGRLRREPFTGSDSTGRSGVSGRQRRRGGETSWTASPPSSSARRRAGSARLWSAALPTRTGVASRPGEAGRGRSPGMPDRRDLDDVAAQDGGGRDLDVGYQRTPGCPVAHRFTAGRVKWSGAEWQGQAHVCRSPARRPAQEMATLPHRPCECRPGMRSTGRPQPRFPKRGGVDEEASANTCQSRERLSRQSRRHDHRALACTLPLPGQHVRTDEHVVLAQEQVTAVSSVRQPIRVGRRFHSERGRRRHSRTGRRCGSAMPALGEVPRSGERDGTADTVEHAAQLLSLIARSPDIARSWGRFAYDRPKGGERDRCTSVEAEVPESLSAESWREVWKCWRRSIDSGFTLPA